MRCFEDYYWFFGKGYLLTFIYILILVSVLVYILVRVIHKYKFRSYALNQSKCPNCHNPVEETYIRCPECHYKLKTNCPSCGKVVKTSWDICPYCEAEL